MSGDRAVSWALRCECGDEMRAASEDELVRVVEAHLAERHPALRTMPKAEDLLAMAERLDDVGAE